MNCAWLSMQNLSRTVGLVFVDEVAVQNVERPARFLVQVWRDECTRFHPNMYDLRTKSVVCIQEFYLDVSRIAWIRELRHFHVLRFRNFIDHRLPSLSISYPLPLQIRFENSRRTHLFMEPCNR